MESQINSLCSDFKRLTLNKMEEDMVNEFRSDDAFLHIQTRDTFLLSSTAEVVIVNADFIDDDPPDSSILPDLDLLSGARSDKSFLPMDPSFKNYDNASSPQIRIYHRDAPLTPSQYITYFSNQEYHLPVRPKDAFKIHYHTVQLNFRL